MNSASPFVIITDLINFIYFFSRNVCTAFALPDNSDPVAEIGDENGLTFGEGPALLSISVSFIADFIRASVRAFCS